MAPLLRFKRLQKPASMATEKSSSVPWTQSIPFGREREFRISRAKLVAVAKTLSNGRCAVIDRAYSVDSATVGAVYDRPNPGFATETNKLTLHIRPRGFEPLTYGFVGDLTPYVRKCPQAYKAVLTWVSAETTVSSVLRIHACLPPWSPQKSPQSRTGKCAA